MRLAYTIVLNGKHHLKHGKFIKTMVDNFDLWVIVEGFAHPNGSTSWCKEVPDGFINENGLSVDGTSNTITNIWENNPNVEYITPKKGKNGWNSKDDMVNAACNVMTGFIGIQKTNDPVVYLWQVDVDEQWTPEDLSAAERDLDRLGGDCGLFLADYYVGKNILAKGTWGEGANGNEYRRLWKWKGQMFSSHEPPRLDGGNGKEVILPQRFRHYAYYFKQDVIFKEKYYGYNGLYERWLALQYNTNFPRPISDLIINSGWATSDTTLILV